MLKEVITTKEAKCAKCHRDIKRSWKAFFDDVSKAIYCKPCGTQLMAGEKAVSPTEDAELLLNELAGNVRLFNDMLGSMSVTLSGIAKSAKYLEESNAEMLKILKVKTKK